MFRYLRISVCRVSDWTPTGVGEPVDELILDDLDVLTDLTHPLRGALYRRLRRPHSAAELAEQMDVPVTRLYHHLNRLEERGVIRVVATRRVGATTERRYQVAARSLRLTDDQFERFDPRELAVAMGALYDFAKLRLQREIETGRYAGRDLEREALLALNEVVLTDSDLDELITRLRSVIDEFTERTRPDDPAARRVALFVAAHEVTD